MYKKLIVTVLLIISTGMYILLKDTQQTMKIKSFSDLKDRERVQISVSNVAGTETETKTLEVEVVKTANSTGLGLSGRTEIGADGMLFVFPTKEIRYFWMKDMKFDIDIVWIAEDRVVAVSRSVPKPLPNTPDFRLETYSAQEPVTMVLELPANDATRLNINSGTVVQLVQ